MNQPAVPKTLTTDTYVVRVSEPASNPPRYF